MFAFCFKRHGSPYLGVAPPKPLADTCQLLPKTLFTVGRASPSVHCRTTQGQWGGVLLLYTASLPCGVGQRNTFCSLPHCLGALGSGTPSVPCLAGLGQWATELPLSLPHCPGAVGRGASPLHYLTAWGQWVVELLLFTASLPWGHLPTPAELSCVPGLPGLREVFISMVTFCRRHFRPCFQFSIRATGWITSTQEPVPSPHNPKNNSSSQRSLVDGQPRGNEVHVSGRSGGDEYLTRLSPSVQDSFLLCSTPWPSVCARAPVC